MSNHLSNLDPPALIPNIPGRTAAFSKRSIMKIPGLGYGMKLADFIPVDRDRRVESAQESIAAARRVLAKGIHITTFVEGTRSRDGRMLPFKKGPFYLAMETGAPVHSRVHSRHRGHDGQGQRANPPRHGSHRLPPPVYPRQLCEPAMN